MDGVVGVECRAPKAGALRPDMQCTLDSKALFNFTATPIRHLSLDRAKIVTNSCVQAIRSRNSALFYRPSGKNLRRNKLECAGTGSLAHLIGCMTAPGIKTICRPARSHRPVSAADKWELGEARTVKLPDSRTDVVLNATAEVSGITAAQSALAAASAPPLSCWSSVCYLLISFPGRALSRSASIQQTSLAAIQDRILPCFPSGDWEVYKWPRVSGKYSSR
jgi:hypothetical protein